MGYKLVTLSLPHPAKISQILHSSCSRVSVRRLGGGKEKGCYRSGDSGVSSNDITIDGNKCTRSSRRSGGRRLSNLSTNDNDRGSERGSRVFFFLVLNKIIVLISIF
jgi:hypothetical protein